MAIIGNIHHFQTHPMVKTIEISLVSVVPFSHGLLWYVGVVIFRLNLWLSGVKELSTGRLWTGLMYLGSFWLCQLVRKSPRAAWTMTWMTCHWKQGLNMPEIDVRNKETPRGRREFFWGKRNTIQSETLPDESLLILNLPNLSQLQV